MSVSDAKIDQLISTIETLAEEIRNSNAARDGSSSTPTLGRGISNSDIQSVFNPQAIQKYNELLEEKSRLLQVINDQKAMGRFADADIINAALEQINTTEKQIEQMNRSADALKNPEKAFKSLTSSFGNLSSGIGKLNLTSITDGFKGMSNSMADIGEAFTSLGDLDSIESMMINIGAAIEKFAIEKLVEFLQKIVDLAVKFEDLERNIRKATGASAEFAKDIRGLRNDVIMAGVSADELAEAHTTLANTFTDYTMMGSQSRQEMLKVTSVLGELGASSADTAQSFQNLTKGLGMTTSAAGQTLIEIEALGKDIGVSASKMASDFNKVSDNVLKLGSKGPQAFKDLAVAAKITGLEIEKITQMTNKFDTFDGAAEQVGKLNAALGGNFVNAMDLMMTTDPTERFNMIRDSILDAGLSFEEMSYHQQQFYADSLGLSSVSDLSKALSGDMDALNGSLGENSAEMEAAEKRAQSLQTFQESLQNLLASFIPVVSPVIDALQGMANWLSENGKIIKTVIGVLMILGGVILVAITWPLETAVAAGLLVAGVVSTLIGLLTMFSDTSTKASKSTSMFSGILEKLGPVGDIIQKSLNNLSKAFSEMKKSFQPLIEYFNMLMDSFMFFAEMAIKPFIFGLKIWIAIWGYALSALIDFGAMLINVGSFFIRYLLLPLNNIITVVKAFKEAWDTKSFEPILNLPKKIANNFLSVFDPLIDNFNILKDRFLIIPNLVINAFNSVKNAIVPLKEQFSYFLNNSFAGSAIMVAMNNVNKIITTVKDSVMELVDGIKLIGSAFTKLINGDFAGMFSDLGAALSKIFINPLINFVNIFIGLVNNVIDLIMGSSIAKWLGDKVGVDTSTFQITELTPFATGGIVEGPTPALVGEAGPEAIIPLDKLQTFISPIVNNPVTQMIQQATSGMFQGGPKEITVYLTLDGKVIDKKIVDVMNQKAVDSLRGF